MSRIQLKTFSSLFIFLVADFALDSRRSIHFASTLVTHFHLLKCKRAFVLVFAFNSYRPGQNKCKLKVTIACRTGVIFLRFLGERSRKKAWSARHTRRGNALSSGILGCRLLKRTCVLCACVCFEWVNISCAYDCFEDILGQK